MAEAVQEATGLQPGERLQIELGRLESGEWYGQIGGKEDETAIAHTSAWPWEVLRGLAKQVKDRERELPAFQLLQAEPGEGVCLHMAADGRLCGVLHVPPELASERVVALRAAYLEESDRADAAEFPGPAGKVEVVRLHALLEKPRNAGDEDAEELVVTLKESGEDMDPQLKALKPYAKEQVLAIIYVDHVLYDQKLSEQVGLKVSGSQLTMFAGSGENGGAGAEQVQESEPVPADPSEAETQTLTPGEDQRECGPAETEAGE